MRAPHEDTDLLRSARQFAILGIHGVGVSTVEGNVARVRMYPDGIDGDAVDEDFQLPEPPPGFPPLEAIHYETVLGPAILRRIEELRGSRGDAVPSPE